MELSFLTKVLSGITIHAGDRISLNDEGQLLEYSTYLDTDQNICGVPCAADFDVWRYVNGRLSRIVLASSALIVGQEYIRGTEISFDRNGEVIDFHVMD